MLDRKSAPQFSALKNFQLPEPEVTRLSNGCSLVCLDIVQQDVIKIELLFKSGKWYEPTPGISHFTAQLLDKGIPGKTAYQIATWFDLFGASVEISAGLDFTSVSLYSLASNVTEILPLFFQLVTNPAFPLDELSQAKDIFSQNLKLNLEKNSFVANRNIRKNIFGELHPYGATLDLPHLDTINPGLLHEYFKSRFIPHEVYITGKLSVPAKNMVMDALSQFQPQALQQPVHYTAMGQQPVQLVEKPESIQTSLRLGKRSINRSHPQYPQLILLNHILGGYFGSRLMKNLREERGLTYGIHSSISPLANDSVFMIGTDVNKQDRELAISEIKNEVNSLCHKPVSKDELMLACNHLLGGLQLDTANPFSVMEKVKTIRTHDLNPEFYNNIFVKISETTPSEINKLAQTHLTPESLYTVAIG
ncbi:MAG TPA: pitrilysin family protein [Cyclobacteriaceae bacterium]|nr:pitrilysin family protein [Cyclobacteriaceae bacterium]